MSLTLNFNLKSDIMTKEIEGVKSLPIKYVSSMVYRDDLNTIEANIYHVKLEEFKDLRFHPGEIIDLKYMNKD